MSNAQKLREMLDKTLPRPAGSPENPSSGEIKDTLFLEIELTSEEEIEALRVARENKHYRLVREEYASKIKEDQERPFFTPEEVLIKFKSVFDVEPESRYEVILKHLCAYFTNDPRSGYDPRKGLLLCGGVGIGKTTLTEFFQRNQKASYRIVSCREIESAYASADKETGGEKAIEQYSHNFKVAVNSNEFGHLMYGYCFDDLGTEVVGKHYGKEKEVMIEVLLNRYDKHLEFFMTHMTTNLSAHEVRSRYGERVFDRMREMFNIIDFPVDAKSRRK